MKLLFLSFLLVPLIFYPINSQRPTCSPFISGDDFRSFCTFIFDSPYPATKASLNFDQAIAFNPADVKDGDTVFVNLFYMEPFFKFFHPYIKSKYILVTHNGDDVVDESFLKYLNDPQLAFWFTQNCQVKHERIIPMPIGLPIKCLPSNINLDITLLKIQQNIKKLKTQKNRLLYLNIATNTNPAERIPLQEHLSKLNFCNIGERKSFANYMIDLAYSKFTVSPEGKGPDCHRTWEAMYVACIPIVKKSIMDPLYEDLPVLIVDKWEDITEKFLEEKYKEMTKKHYNFNKLYIKYWFDLIQKYQQKVKDNSL
ncbi:TPA: hypothetical protein DIC20_03945 [Candidatus Dependentiae bacterium]|nr:MAG: hypothetical protein US03_C0001G0176 [candidate division TM6 bacterium GW2011_GWF2_36_131]KKQ03688.1 MAG: hypothetical protein US13_C0001G0028 [candidate division TM6 bacterium GW2011_GWE2_36_25]KKQ20076.1 MAG: hypothetical protein US32_C0002G0081 [candidate division TM6 bacterium GW2011_GWA2_36_9]HBR70455.1 hypothetical protein [Candidatus Dependentiae bacterium]HCU00829.1 hypothetical protein [Candidatus Dependentiae bacterium]